jgi:hypothetical protein
MGMARYAAESGIGVARDVAGSGIGVAREMAGTALAQILAMRANGTEPEPPRPEPTPPPAPAPRADASPAATVPPDAAWTTDVPSSEALPIPDYDELSASQVVERLDGLDHESLEAVRRYETEHRGRKTILGKIAQLS